MSLFAHTHVHHHSLTFATVSLYEIAGIILRMKARVKKIKIGHNYRYNTSMIIWLRLMHKIQSSSVHLKDKRISNINCLIKIAYGITVLFGIPTYYM